MQIVFGAITVLAGLVAVLAGAYGLRQTRRIRGAGHSATAVVKPPPPGGERPLLQYETRDGRVVEIVSPVPRLPEGSRTRLSYDPDDPREVVVDGHERTGVEWAFVAAGLVVMVIGLGVAALGAAGAR
ncbi:DUF3592 domain-containing protein [Streptomyces sp. NPDC051018]|uniref:DUF3592 domain-containing protein n=1 Tax=Streptomyces sp. NPDC051018 TaxID=3365639 RepID=UPI00379C9A3A